MLSDWILLHISPVHIFALLLISSLIRVTKKSILLCPVRFCQHSLKLDLGKSQALFKINNYCFGVYRIRNLPYKFLRCESDSILNYLQEHTKTLAFDLSFFLLGMLLKKSPRSFLKLNPRSHMGFFSFKSFSDNIF